MSHGKCTGCATNFGFLTKERQCGNCDQIFCSKCVSNKLSNTDKHRNDKDIPHCQRCFLILTGKLNVKTSDRPPSPPANFKREMERKARDNEAADLSALAVPGAAPINPASTGDEKKSTKFPRLKPQYRGLSVEEMDIAERLERLKEARKEREGVTPLPEGVQPEDDIAMRLARLRGEKTTTGRPSPPPLIHKPPLSQPEQVDQLLKEIAGEIQLENKSEGRQEVSDGPDIDLTSGNKNESSQVGDDEIVKLITQTAHQLEVDAQQAVDDLKKDEEIWNRLKLMKKKTANQKSDKREAEKSSSDEDDDDEDTVKQTIIRLVEDRKLEEKYNSMVETTKDKFKKRRDQRLSEKSSSDEELPWCCICNEDATIRCEECDGDLYCKRCFREGHELELDHKPTKYKSPQFTDS